MAKMRGKAFAAPCAVVLVASPDPGVQRAGVGAGGLGLVHRLRHGSGRDRTRLRAVWKSAAVLETEPVRTLFALTEHEQLLGWVNLGTPGQTSTRKTESERTGLAGLVTVIGDDHRPVSAAVPGPSG